MDHSAVQEIGQEAARCTICGELKPLSKFARQSGMASGHINQCYACRSKRTRQNPAHREKQAKIHKAWYEAHAKTPERRARKAERMRAYRLAHVARERYLARMVTWRAIKAGRLTRQPCEVCGATKVQAHHADYGKPLDVRWLCRPHHLELHRRLA